MQTVLKIEATGTIRGLYTEALDLLEFGALHVRRASLVEWDDDRRGWTVTANDGTFLAGPFLSRSLAVTWEIGYWNTKLFEVGFVPPTEVTQ
jgi:hypothetical protein